MITLLLFIIISWTVGTVFGPDFRGQFKCLSLQRHLLSLVTEQSMS